MYYPNELAALPPRTICQGDYVDLGHIISGTIFLWLALAALALDMFAGIELSQMAFYFVGWHILIEFF